MPDDAWPEQREAVLKRDRDCRAWGEVIRCWGPLQVHHIMPKGMGGSKREYALEELITLCAAHHDYVHEHPAWSVERGYLRERRSSGI